MSISYRYGSSTGMDGKIQGRFGLVSISYRYGSSTEQQVEKIINAEKCQSLIDMVVLQVNFSKIAGEKRQDLVSISYRYGSSTFGINKEDAKNHIKEVVSISYRYGSSTNEK